MVFPTKRLLMECPVKIKPLQNIKQFVLELGAMLTKSVILVTLLGGALAAVSKPTCNENLTEDYVRDPEACNRYYRCVNGQMHDFSCPFGMHWQQEERKCVLEGQSTCRVRKQKMNQQRSKLKQVFSSDKF